jgi:protein-S-isoprenylcysteine O-methyltransferase Ste14
LIQPTPYHITSFEFYCRNIAFHTCCSRGEQYVGAIFVLSCSIIIGLHSILEMLIRFLISVSAFLYILVGLALIVFGLFELRANVSLFHLPIERNKLITSGVFCLVRHPMYSGLLLLCIGLTRGIDG